MRQLIGYVAGLGVLAAAGAATAQDDTEWQDLLTCGLLTPCAPGAANCAPEELLTVVRVHRESGRYELFDLNNRIPHAMELTRRGRFLIFDGGEDHDQPRASSSVERLVVAENGAATFQYAFYIQVDAENWRLISGENTGQCTQVMP